MKSFGFVLILGLLGCAQHHCRQTPALSGEIIPPIADEVSVSPKDQTVRVFKYDGSLQCQKAKGTSVEAMAKELKGIKVVSQAKQPDGLMHIQMCGANTGMTNVYEIPLKDLAKAEKLGFKKWTF